ncbi:MAG: hypothetical protein ACK5TR_07095 [Alphaproteobacteria bacterium]|nr:hypothetical protein [Alphaproteobacteria bacterium]
MSGPFLGAALALSEMVPSLAKWFSSEKGNESTGQMIAAKVVDAAKRITGQKDALGAVEILRHDPKLFVDFQNAMAKLDHDLERAFIGDRQSARARDIAIAQSGKRNVRADIMVVCAAVGLIFCLVALAMYKDYLTGEAVGIISTISGIFGSCLKDAYSFEFGSSRERKDKEILGLFK